MKYGISPAEMAEIYEKVKTPYKHGAVLTFPDALCDSPTLFTYRGQVYMSFIKIDRVTRTSGYESYLARSADMKQWEILFPTLRRREECWDAKQCAAYAGFVENDLFGNYAIQSVNGRQYVSYLGGNLDGYETDPLATGLCRMGDILDPATYERLPEPILSPKDADAREGERLTLYKSQLFIDEARTLGHRYVNAYNAKDTDHIERIFLAVSDDGEHWMRYGDRYMFAHPGAKITGDPQILRYGSYYILFYFVLKDGVTIDTFAVSRDLIHWTRWEGKPLIEREYEWENRYAHKPAMIWRDGVLYHYYCAVNEKGERCIALATSR